MITIGVDPGLSGAIGVLKNGIYLAVLDMPTVAKGSGSVKNEVNPAELMTLLKQHVLNNENVSVVLERVNSMPGQGVSSTFSLGDSFGCARSIIAACRYELTYTSPAHWKKFFNLGSDKDASRALAIRLFPTAPLGLKKHSDRAEALLMARWLYDTRFRK